MQYIRRLLVLKQRLLFGAIALVTLLLGGGAPAIANAQAVSQRQQLFSAAAKEFNVPESLLLAVSYNESRWQSHDGSASIDGGYGLMNLTTKVATQDGKGTGQAPTNTVANRAYSLDKASQLLQTPVKELQSNDRQNVRGGAVVLAAYAKQLNNGALPSAVGDWYSAVAQYASSTSQQGASSFADDVFSTVQNGAQLTTIDGQSMILAPSKVTINHQTVNSLDLKATPQTMATSNAECPTTLNCRFVPAGYAQNSADPTDYGNYDHANRPADMDIKYIVIHDTEGSYQSAINHFQDTTSYVSGNYIIRSSDGAITQMVRNEDVSWGAGDWYVNMHGINIEHEGFAAQGKTWYTEAMYKSSATLVRYLANKYHLPLDREHIIGHDNVPTISPSRMSGQHWDTGPYWDWNHYMALLHGVSDQTERAQEAHQNSGNQKTVTIAPNFKTNQQSFADCTTGTCTTLPTQASSAVFVRKQPNANAPLLSDPYTHSDGAAGTNHIDDWGSVAASGQQFAVAGQQGNWIAIWYGGQKGWIYNPASNPVAYATQGSTVTPRVGKSSIPVWGAAYPEASAYPQDGTVPVQTLQPLYAMPAGQAYKTTGEVLPTDYFYDQTVDYSLPHDHMIVIGYQKYYQIMFNHRIAYVLASDVRFQK